MSSPRRRLSALDTTLFVMGGIFGVGIFFTPSSIAARVPEAWAYLTVWGFGGLVAICAAFTFAELGASFPRAGGWFVFLREAFGPFPAYMFAWIVMFVVSTGATAAMTVFCADMLHRVAPDLFGAPDTTAHRLVAASIVVGVTLVTMTGVRRGVWVQNVCMYTKLAVIGGLILAAFFLLPGVSGLERRGAPPEHGSIFAGMLSALLPVFFSYGGWQMICYIAPQVREPERTLPRAIVIGILTVVAVYLAFNVAALYGLGIERVAGDSGFAGELARAAIGDVGDRVMSAGMAISALGVCAVTIIGSPWLYVAMARERLFFESFGRLHPRTGAPVLALGVQCAVTLVYLRFGTLSFLVDSVVFVEWFFHGLAAWALLRLRRRPDVPRPFRSPLFPLAPLVYLVAALLVVCGTLWQAEWRLKGTGLAIVAVGALVYRPWRTWFAGRSS